MPQPISFPYRLIGRILTQSPKVILFSN